MANVAAQENNTSSDNSKNQPTTVFLDMKNKTGHLVYKEEYYSQNGSGGVKLDKRTKYFDKDINTSQIKLTFNRSLDKSGMPYEGSMIKAIAILDNKTILNNWYKDNPKNSTSNAAASKKTPGFEAMAALGLISLMYLIRNIRIW
jgi:hypothetical protein